MARKLELLIVCLRVVGHDQTAALRLLARILLGHGLEHLRDANAVRLEDLVTPARAAMHPFDEIPYFLRDLLSPPCLMSLSWAL